MISLEGIDAEARFRSELPTRATKWDVTVHAATVAHVSMIFHTIIAEL
jgi:hypothetical protein